MTLDELMELYNYALQFPEHYNIIVPRQQLLELIALANESFIATQADLPWS